MVTSSNENKKILALTGIRSEYDILYPVLSELRDYGHDIGVVVTGAHLSQHHADTWKRIEQDGFKIIDKIDSLLSTERLTQRAKGTGIIIQGLTQTVENVNPDFTIVVGDREESTAAAIVCNYLNKLMVHIGGGDSAYGDSDGPIRFAVSKLAHIHCCFADQYKENLLMLGEEDFRVLWTGNPAYRNFDRIPLIGRKELLEHLGLEDKKYIVLMKHPFSSEVEETTRHTDITLKSLESFCVDNDFQTVFIEPNSDPGSLEILRAAENYENKPWFNISETLSRENFINLMRHASALIGNSSMGILEAPHYKLPVVNVGNRQKGRLNAGNVIFVDHQENEIITALEESCLNKEYISKVKNIINPYGDGSAPTKIREFLESINVNDPKWYTKKRLIPFDESEHSEEEKFRRQKRREVRQKQTTDQQPQEKVEVNTSKVVLCIAPHPDDETLGCGGSLLRHKAEGDEIHWLIMTTMEVAEEEEHSNEMRNQRAQEINEVAKLFAFESFYQCSFTTSQLERVPLQRLINEVSAHIRKIQPSIVYLPYAGDIHTDHKVVFDTVLSATKTFRHPYISSLRCYETLSETEFNIDPEIEAFRPNLWINITDYLEEKINIMNIYEGEMGRPPFPRSGKNIRALAHLRGSTSNFEEAEAFMSLKELL